MKLGDLLATATAIVLPIAVTLWAAAKGREEKEEERAGGELTEWTITIK